MRGDVHCHAAEANAHLLQLDNQTVHSAVLGELSYLWAGGQATLGLLAHSFKARQHLNGNLPELSYVCEVHIKCGLRLNSIIMFGCCCAC